LSYLKPTTGHGDVTHFKYRILEKRVTAIELTPDLARICAELTGDGHIQLMKHKRVGLISFYSKHYYEIKDFTARFQKIFNLESHIYPDNRDGNKRYKLFFFSRPVADYLVSIGVPAGNKTNQPFFVPKWIFEGSDALKAAYLQGLFTTEGSIHATRTDRGPRWRIDIEMYKWTELKEEAKQFMMQIGQMLNSLGVKCSPVCFGRTNLRKNGTKSIATKLAMERSAFQNFQERVGFSNKEKAAKLAAVLG